MLGTLSRPLGKPGLEVPTASRYEYWLTHHIPSTKREERQELDLRGRGHARLRLIRRNKRETSKTEKKKKTTTANQSTDRVPAHTQDTRTVSKISNHPCPSVSVPSCRSRGSPLLGSAQNPPTSGANLHGMAATFPPGRVGPRAQQEKSKKLLRMGAEPFAWLGFCVVPFLVMLSCQSGLMAPAYPLAPDRQAV